MGKQPFSKSPLGGDSGGLIHCIVKPSSRTDEVKVLPDGSLRIKIKAPPVDGRANEYLIRYLSGLLKIPKSDITIISGFTSSHKRIRINGNEKMLQEFFKGKP
ncbi:MAG: DUF167 domain-containing protein [Bacteroidetes bacterium]|nr:DUF167 domain-containing protein [Bacteroidota bacterium]